MRDGVTADLFTTTTTRSCRRRPLQQQQQQQQQDDTRVSVDCRNYVEEDFAEATLPTAQASDGM